MKIEITLSLFIICPKIMTSRGFDLIKLKFNFLFRVWRCSFESLNFAIYSSCIISVIAVASNQVSSLISLFSFSMYFWSPILFSVNDFSYLYSLFWGYPWLSLTLCLATACWLYLWLYYILFVCWVCYHLSKLIVIIVHSYHIIGHG